MISVPPLYPLEAVSVVVPAPLWMTLPVPLTNPFTVMAVLRRNSSVALFSMPVNVGPVVPPSPMASVPSAMFQAFPIVPSPVSVQVLLPVFERKSKFRNCPVAPTFAMSNVASTAPPKRRMSLPPVEATTLPLITDPARSSSVRVLPEAGPMSIALAPPAPAAIVPLLITETPQAWLKPRIAAEPLPPSIKPPLLLVRVIAAGPRPRIAAPPVLRSAFDPPRIVPLLTMKLASLRFRA